MMETTMTTGVEPIPTPTSTAPILPADYSGPTRPLTATSDEVEDMNDWLDTEQGCKPAAVPTRKAIETTNT
jgi:hypothetical protein